MFCPQCKSEDNKVLETRVQRDGGIRRRRECLGCKARFTTVETILQQYPYVLKKDGTREPFSKEKLKKGIQLACLKRPVSLAAIEEMVKKISQDILQSNVKDIRAIQIGELVMAELKKIDDVAYVRFASVYKTFHDIQEFVQTLEGDIL